MKQRVENSRDMRQKDGTVVIILIGIGQEMRGVKLSTHFHLVLR
jgi:hypothetical protein